ncbi:hypothetical protein GALMADRAFT_77836, partial [Galerina marginata CBS 339.88]
PACAFPCIVGADLDGCAPTDNVCLCTSEPFVNSTTSCIESKCTGDDLIAAEQFAEALCAAVVSSFTVHH